MCYINGSIEHTLGICPMCKVYKPSGRCPHIRETCRNRVNHPRCEILYLTNAEVQCFNGCGYCKWAATHPPGKPGHLNQGWPGCCRAPGVAEHRMVQPADWPSVSIVHSIPVPSEIKSILDRASLPGMTRAASSTVPSTPERKFGKPNTSAKTSIPMSPPRQLPSSRERSDSAERDPNATTPRRRNDGKLPMAGNTTNTNTAAKMQPRKSLSSPTKPLISKSASPQSSPIILAPKRLEPVASSGSSSSGSDGRSSMTDSTLTSDGGFTDYLSDESEAELQRLAEAKAALFAQNQMEELEFKFARQQLTTVDLRPPKTWNPSSNSPRLLASALPRS